MAPTDLREPLDELARPPQRFDSDLRFPPPERIRVYDDTLRDGEQMPGVAFSPQVKYELAVAHRNDRSGYSDAKSDFIRGIEDQARSA